MRASLSCPLVFALLALAGIAQAQQQPNPDSPRYKGVVALEAFFASEGDAALDAFIADHIAPSMTEPLGVAPVREKLAEMRAHMATASMRGAMPVSEFSARIVFIRADGDEETVSFELDPEDPPRFTWIAVGELEVG